MVSSCETILTIIFSYGVSQNRDAENLWQCSRQEIRLNLQRLNIQQNNSSSSVAIIILSRLINVVAFMLHYLMLHYFNIELNPQLHIALFYILHCLMFHYLMLHHLMMDYFHVALVAVALFNFLLFLYFLIKCCTILLLHYISVALVYVYCTINVGLF